jgi:hypothetical protein
MIRILFGIFMVLHGLVHLLYFGQSARIFELKPGMVWPDGSWFFSRLVGDGTGRALATISLIAAAIGFIAAGIALIFKHPWHSSIAVGAVIISSLVYILFWNGKMQDLDGQGGIGILINSAILISLFVLLKPYLR